MVNAATPLRADASATKSVDSEHDHLRDILRAATSCGWDVEHLNTIPSERPFTEAGALGLEQTAKRDRLVKSLLQRFSRVLTPPVPCDLEQCIRSKNPRDWLPWEEEVVQKAGCWRAKIEEVRAELLEELTTTLLVIRDS